MWNQTTNIQKTLWIARGAPVLIGLICLIIGSYEFAVLSVGIGATLLVVKFDFDYTAVSIVMVILVCTITLIRIDDWRSAKALQLAQQVEIEQKKVGVAKLVREYVTNKEAILVKISTLIAEGHFETAADMMSRYSDFCDDKLTAFCDGQLTSLHELVKSGQEEDLFSKVRSYSASEWVLNRDGYRRLLQYNPTNAQYQKKLNYYQSLIDKGQRQRERAKAFFYSNGRFRPLEEAVIDMKFPNVSKRRFFEHVSTSHEYHDTYIKVTMKYRAASFSWTGPVQTAIARVSWDGEMSPLIQFN